MLRGALLPLPTCQAFVILSMLVAHLCLQVPLRVHLFYLVSDVSWPLDIVHSGNLCGQTALPLNCPVYILCPFGALFFPQTSGDQQVLLGGWVQCCVVYLGSHFYLHTCTPNLSVAQQILSITAGTVFIAVAMKW